MHPIPVRMMKLDVPDAAALDPVFIAGDARLSYGHAAVSLFVELLEPFFVKSLHRVMPRITDEALREDADRFCRQEGQHYRRHGDFNEIILSRGYPGLKERVARLAQDFDGYLANESDRFRIGYIEGFESFTTQFAIHAIGGGLYDDPRTDPAFGDLFRWHMLEEIEHRNVAFDVYEHLEGGWAYRAYMCWFAQGHMFRFIRDCTKLIEKAEVARHGNRCRVTPKQELMFFLLTAPKRARTLSPGYTPHDYRIPPGIEALSARYTERATSVR